MFSISQLPTWPTVNGWTEEVATQACEQGLKSHELWDTCSYATNTTDIVSSCVTDILVYMCLCLNLILI